MRTPGCMELKENADALVRRELDAETIAALERHAAGCGACGQTLGDARAAWLALDVLRGEALDEELGPARLGPLRANVMASVRSQAASRPAADGVWAWLRWAPALTTAALVALLGLRLPGQMPLTGGAAPALAPTTGEVSLVTLASRGGVTLRWQGSGSTYLVYRSHRPGDFQTAEVTVVCGTSWTDREVASGPLYYRVVAAPEPCRS